MTHEERAKAWKREDISRRREAAHIEENFGRPYSDQDSHDSLAEQFREVERETQPEPCEGCRKTQRIALDSEPEAILGNFPWQAAQFALKAKDTRLREVVRAGDALRESVRISYQSAFPQSHAAPPVVAAWDAATKDIQR